MATEDLTTFTESDPGGTITLATDRITYTNYRRDQNGRAYKDYGADYFGDFVHEFEYRLTTNHVYSYCNIWCVNNDPDYVSAVNGRQYSLRVGAGGLAPLNRLYLYHYNNGVNQSNTSKDLSLNTTYYLRVTHAGTSLKCEVFSDAARTTLVETLGPLTVVDDTFQYLMIAQTLNTGSARITTGWAQNYNLDAGAQSGSADLKAEFEVALPSGSADLKALFTVRQDSYADLKAVFEVGQNSADLFSEMTIRQTATVDLFAEFELQLSQSLFAEAVIRQVASADLKAVAIIRTEDSQDLFSEFTVRHSATKDLFAEFLPRNPGAAELYAKFEVLISDAAVSLFAEFTVRHTATKDLYAEFELQLSQSLFAEAVIRQVASADLKAVAIIINRDTRDLLAEFTVRHTGFKDLFAEFIPRRSAFSDVFAELIVRHRGTADLYAEMLVTRPGSEDLLSEFVVRHSSTKELYAEFMPRRSASVELLARVKVSKGTLTGDVYARFYVRPDTLRAEDLTIKRIGRMSISDSGAMSVSKAQRGRLR